MSLLPAGARWSPIATYGRLAGSIGLLLASLLFPSADVRAADGEAKRVLLLGQKPDDHPRGTHEYLAGMKVLAKCLRDVPGLTVDVISADAAWADGPERIRQADGVVLFVSEGAKWIHQDARRLEAFAQLAARGGGLVTLHWGMGTRDAQYIPGFLRLFGGCHGGPDRKYKVVDAQVQVAAHEHPINRGIEPVAMREEFYYQLKMIDAERVQPIWQTAIDGKVETIAWAWQRADGGRAFGYSGGHFHTNWSQVQYRRLMAQAVLWTLQMPIPEAGLPVKVTADDLALPEVP